MSFDDLIASNDTSLDDLASFFDALDHRGRMDALSKTSKAQQRKLWEIAADAPSLDATFFVPEGVADRTEVIHHGRNTLPAFNSFQKRFARPDGGGDLFGYNEGATRPLIGPGYFVAHTTAGNPTWESRSAYVIDYFMVPSGATPSGWPAIKPNSSGLQMFVYNKTRDFMRRVSDHVSIGMAFKVEKSLNNWFTLIREDR
jgi:hypothetical protein